MGEVMRSEKLVALGRRKTKRNRGIWSGIAGTRLRRIFPSKPRPYRRGERMSLISALDDRGRQVERLNRGRIGAGERGVRAGRYAGREAIDYPFALHKSQFVEFLARPE